MHLFLPETDCSVATTVSRFESLDLHSGSNMNSIHTGTIDLYTNLAPANNSTDNKLYYCPV